MKSLAPLKIYLIFLGVILIWGFAWPMNKIGLDYMPTLWHAAMRLGIGCLTMFAIVITTGKYKLPTKQDLPIILTLGLLQIGLFILLVNSGLAYVDAGRSSILVYTVPLWATPIAILFFNEKLNLLKTLGLCLGLIGIMLLFSPWSIDWHNRQSLCGNGILLCAAICMAISICCARNLKWHSSALELLPWQLLVATIPGLIIAYLFSPSPTVEWDTTSIAAMAYTAVLATALGNGLIAVVSKQLPSITVSLGLMGVPLTGVISAALILGESITRDMQLAMLFIFSGLILVVLAQKFQKKPI